MIGAACTIPLPEGDKSTYIGSHHPLPQDGIRPSRSSPAVLPAERANFDSELPHHSPKEIAYSDDNDSLQRDCPNQECEGH